MVCQWFLRLICINSSENENDRLSEQNDTISSVENFSDCEQNNFVETLNSNDLSINAADENLNRLEVTNRGELLNELERSNTSRASNYDIQQRQEQSILPLSPNERNNLLKGVLEFNASNSAQSDPYAYLAYGSSNTNDADDLLKTTTFIKSNHGTDSNKLINKKVVSENLPENDSSNSLNKKAAEIFIKHLQECITATKNCYDLQRNTIFIKDGSIRNKNMNTKKFELISVDKILCSKDIRSWQTKVKLESQNHKDPSLICTVTSFGTNHLELMPRNFDLSKICGTFNARLYPNYKQIKYAERGIAAIEKNDEMLQKLWIGINKRTKNDGTKVHILKNSANEITEMFRFAVKKIRPTLICTQTNSDVENIILNLKHIMPRQFEDGLIIRLTTILPPHSNEALKNRTKTLAEINHLNRIIICTLGIAPKLAENGIKNNFFKNIFILNAQKSSELDSLMVLGLLANVQTKIFLCGSAINNVKMLTDFVVPQEQNTSMFTRLRNLCLFPNNIKSDDKIVIQL